MKRISRNKQMEHITVALLITLHYLVVFIIHKLHDLIICDSRRVLNIYIYIYIYTHIYIYIYGDRPEKDLNGTLTLWPFEN